MPSQASFPWLADYTFRRENRQIIMPEFHEIIINVHMHTRYSDGHGSHADIGAAALRAGLDAVIVTDHNVWVSGPEDYYQEGSRRTLVLIGEEVHDTVDQFFRVEAGEGKFIVNEGEEHLVSDGDAVVIPAGTKHNVVNVSPDKPLKLYTIYSPPNHPVGTIHKTKEEAEAFHHD